MAQPVNISHVHRLSGIEDVHIYKCLVFPFRNKKTTIQGGLGLSPHSLAIISKDNMFYLYIFMP